MNEMTIKFKIPDDEKWNRYIYAHVSSGSMSGGVFLTLSQAALILNDLQQAVWHAEMPKEKEEQ